ncbi:MAG: macro domain-containing protein, partial [Candidatus Hydrogenedentes bacterium]|nr:macro domain-containing protein [Candidatus Hydrogenedentota bacterium]
HTVGPVYRDGKHDEPRLLASCHRRSLEVAVEHGLKTVSFPAISCGVYGYPIPDAARIAVSTVEAFLKVHPAIERVRFVLFSREVQDIFARALDALPDY